MRSVTEPCLLGGVVRKFSEVCKLKEYKSGDERHQFRVTLALSFAFILLGQTITTRIHDEHNGRK